MNREKFEAALRIHERIGELEAQRKSVASIDMPCFVTLENSWETARVKPPCDVAEKIRDVLLDWLDGDVIMARQELDMMLEDKEEAK